MLEKLDGRDVLQRVFQEAGLEPIRDCVVELGPQPLKLDGYDPVRRVGYEYITLSDPQRVEELDRLNRDGLCRVLLVDEQLIRDAHELAAAARAFLQCDE